MPRLELGKYYSPDDGRQISEAPAISGQRLTDSNNFRLTPRQTQVLSGLAEGKKTSQIGSQLKISNQTVRGFIGGSTDFSGIYEKLGVGTALGAVIGGVEAGYLSLEDILTDEYLAIADKFSFLTKRQLEIMDIWIVSMNGDAVNKEIANSLNIAPDTVKNHFTDIRKRLGILPSGHVRTRLGLLYYIHKKNEQNITLK